MPSTDGSGTPAGTLVAVVVGTMTVAVVEKEPMLMVVTDGATPVLELELGEN